MECHPSQQHAPSTRPTNPAQSPATAPITAPATPAAPDAPAASPAAWRMLDAEWQPRETGFFVVVQVYGTPERVLAAIERFARGNDLVLQMDAAIELPSSAWEQLPPRLLSNVQQALVREDLRNTKRLLIAEKLCISPNTVTAYRSIIRKQFLSLPEALRPVWVLTWLRRFPGTKLAPQRPRRSSKPKRP